MREDDQVTSPQSDSCEEQPNASGRHRLLSREPIPAPDFEQILCTLRDTLGGRGSGLVVEGSLDPQFHAQVMSILTEAAARIADRADERVAAVAVDYAAAPGLEETGRLRASQNMHPAESLTAAELLFDHAIEPLADWADSLPRAVAAIQVARILHHSIFRRFPPGAIAYTQAMRERLSAAHQESRLRLSRDLHDRVAHGIAAGLQRIELSTLNSGRMDPELDAAARALRDTLADVQTLALDLRQLVAGRRLDTAIEEYAADTATLTPGLSVVSTGRPVPILSGVAEEIFMIALEAIRNARTHAAGATAITVQVDWTSGGVVVTVTDDGAGFDHDDVATGSIGLLDMRERAESISGQLTITTSANPGTSIRLAWTTP
jgi:signal transduction histidine kinase